MTGVPGENPRVEGVTGARRTGLGNIEEPERKQRKWFLTKNILLILKLMSHGS